MENEIVAPLLSYEDIFNKANGFLEIYHPPGEIPVPIEEIVEFQLNINIIPIPGLHLAIDTDGFISSDLTSISVDQFVFESRPARYRFTLAHEVGHYILHDDLYRRCNFRSIDEWKVFVNSISEREYSWIEWQAYSFAGLTHFEQFLGKNGGFVLVTH